jgi:hypothetical protein
VETLRVDNYFIDEISCCLQLDDKEHPLELLPELQELTYYRRGHIIHRYSPERRRHHNRGQSLPKPMIICVFPDVLLNLSDFDHTGKQRGGE